MTRRSGGASGHCGLVAALGAVVALGTAGCTATIQVAGTSEAANSASATAGSQASVSWDFSIPLAPDQETALSALVAAVASYPGDYAGTTVTDTADGPAVTVHFLFDVEPRFSVDDFMGAAAAAGVLVSSDRKLYSEAALTEIRDSVATFEPLSGKVVSAEIDFELNVVRIQVTGLNDSMVTSTADEYGSAVLLVG